MRLTYCLHHCTKVVHIPNVDLWFKFVVDVVALKLVHADNCQGPTQPVAHGKASNLFEICFLVPKDVAIQDQVE